MVPVVCSTAVMVLLAVVVKDGGAGSVFHSCYGADGGGGKRWWCR